MYNEEEDYDRKVTSENHDNNPDDVEDNIDYVHYHKFQERTELNTNEKIQEYRNQICTGAVGLLNQQAFLSNYINPDTPYPGVLIFHGTRTGKCIHKDTNIALFLLVLLSNV